MARTTLALALLLACGLAGAQDRPNILWLTTEDNAAHWYRLYDPEHGVAMPTVERLAAEGLVFERAYSCAPVCSERPALSTDGAGSLCEPSTRKQAKRAPPAESSTTTCVCVAGRRSAVSAHPGGDLILRCR